MFYCDLASCIFDKAITTPIVFFEVFTIIATIISLYFLFKIEKKIFLKFFTVMVGIFIFESFTHPLWINSHLGAWAYMYRDVSWILTIGWATIIIVPVVLIDRFFKEATAQKKFLLYLLAMIFFGILGETAVVNLGIRSYSPEVMEVISGKYIPFLNIPWSALYYIPVFMSLVIGFFKFWELVIDKELVIPSKRVKWGRILLFSTIGVFLFEIMIEAMVVNAKLPSWSYIYRDVSFVMTGGWVIMIWAAVSLVNKFFIHFGLVGKFFSYIVIVTAIATPVEAYLIKGGVRVYGQSSIDNFSGFKVLFTEVPVEILFAVPFYLALILSFVGYWVFQYNQKSNQYGKIK